jgi:phenylacetate-coenzyme A ligase PaaK-like adenylate-forming protein
MTEMGLGCAVSCEYQNGYHVREADLYLEIIDPDTGRPVPDGQWGEIVFTSLTRVGMPFIRYRTGDISRWKTESCRCGSKLKLLDYIQDRKLEKGKVNLI